MIPVATDEEGGKALRLRGVCFAYGPQEILREIDLTLPPGRKVALVGPSGCGKTTLLQLCQGLREPTEGCLDNRFTRPATVFQSPSLLPWKTAADNLALGLRADGWTRRAARRRVEAEARRMGLASEDLDKYPGQLSGGMQNRVGLGRAMVLEPDLLLLDEPFSALDIGLKTEFYRHLDALADTTVLLVTHDLAEAVRLADEVLLMDRSPGRIAGHYTFERAFDARTGTWVAGETECLCTLPEVRRIFGFDSETCTPAKGGCHD